MSLQQNQQESIYKIIPHNPEETPRRLKYKSKYPYNIPPTGSTFNNHTTSKPKVSNLSGEFNIGIQTHSAYALKQTFGDAPGKRMSSPNNFMKKNTGIATLPAVRSFSYDCAFKKQKIPLASQRPILKQGSNKNFILANTIQNILSTTQKKAEPINWMKKKDFGQTPEYLEKIKETLTHEYETLRNLQIMKQIKQNPQPLPQEELHKLREGLKNKWNSVNKQYQMLTHIRILDTHGLRKKKQTYQKQLQQIQEDIRKLNKQYIFVNK